MNQTANRTAMAPVPLSVFSSAACEREQLVQQEQAWLQEPLRLLEQARVKEGGK